MAGTGSKACTTGSAGAGDDCVGVRSGTASTPIGTGWNAAACTGAGAGATGAATGAGGAVPGPPGPPSPPLPPSPAPIFSSLWLSFFELSSMSVMVVLPLLSPVLYASTLVVSVLSSLPTLLSAPATPPVVATGALMSPPAATAPSPIACTTVLLSP